MVTSIVACGCMFVALLSIGARAARIGAWVCLDGTQDGTLHGDNTDWLAMRTLITQTLAASNRKGMPCLLSAACISTQRTRRAARPGRSLRTPADVLPFALRTAPWALVADKLPSVLLQPPSDALQPSSWPAFFFLAEGPPCARLWVMLERTRRCFSPSASSAPFRL